jgi:YidC/Oxa1 family membrane protein insertase
MDKRSLIFVGVLAAGLFFVNHWFDSKDADRRAARAAQKKTELVQEAPKQESVKTAAAVPGNETFYVLETPYQQLVFSSKGGSIAEINLPLQSKDHQDSIVRAIDFDKEMQANAPKNDRFPTFPYQTMNGTVQEGKLGGYYPLLRRPVFNEKGNLLTPISPNTYACSLISQDGDLDGLTYRVTKFEKNLIQFEASHGGRKIVKTYTLPKNPKEAPYCLDVSIKVDGNTKGLWVTSGVPEVELISGNYSPSLKYQVKNKKKTQVEQVSLPKTSTALTAIQPNWVCNSNGFMGLIFDPQTEIGSGFTATMLSGEKLPTRLSVIDRESDLYPADKYPGYEIQLPLSASQGSAEFRVFAGPFATDVLKIVDAQFADAETGNHPDYMGSQTSHGWFSFISEPFAKFLFFLMNAFYQFTHSWGIAIIMLTIALRIMLYPLNAWSIKSTLRMQQIAPLVSAIQEKFKKDPKRAQMEVMSLYKEKKVNPLGGCLPMLIQMPFLIGMFDLLKSTFELRGASFIPGWIDNLSAPDVLFSWGTPIMFFGSSFHLLPVLLGAVMYFQQKMTSPLPKNKKLWTDQQKQQRMMGNIMTIVFTVMFYNFPSGLNIYWLSSMLLGILQQWMTAKKMKQNPNIEVM